MPSTLELCEKYFGTQDIYKLLEIDKNALEKDIKKAYYKLSLKVHPDRVSEEEKELATEKFKVLSKINEVLTDTNKKALYDERGIIDDDDDEGKLGTWLELWTKIFKPITTEDIDNFKKDYIGSDLELRDIEKAYLGGNGCLDYMLNAVPFMEVEDEPRIQEIVKKMIKEKKVPEYKCFTNEPAAKTKKRHHKYAKERRQAEKEIKKNNKKSSSESLEQQIMKRQNERMNSFSSLIDSLTSKYGNGDESEDPEFEMANLYQQKKKSKGKKKAKISDEGKPADRRVTRGRVTKN